MPKFVIRGIEAQRKTVGAHGNVSAVYLPKKWVGRNVVVVLLPKVITDAEEK